MASKDGLRSYWTERSDSPTMETMLCNKEAEALFRMDMADIVSALPDLTGKRMVEMGAGIGRFTGYFAQRAQHLIATDLIESFIEKNKESHPQLDNITYLVSDATHLQLKSSSADLVFTNWLLMYLTDDEVVHFLAKALHWLTPDGHIHIRESCTEPSTLKKKCQVEENPTHYRHISQYIELLNGLVVVCENGIRWRFEILWAKPVPAYIHIYGNWRQVHLLAKKMRVVDPTTRFEQPSENLSHVLGRFAIERQTMTDKRLSAFATDIQNQNYMEHGMIVSALKEYLSQYKATIRRILLLCADDLLSVLLPHFIAEISGAEVTLITCDIYMFSALLGYANVRADKRVRYHWLPGTIPEVETWGLPHREEFDAAVVVEPNAQNLIPLLQNLKKCLKSDTSLLLFWNDGAKRTKSDEMQVSKQTVDNSGSGCLEAINRCAVLKPNHAVASGLDSLYTNWQFLTIQ